MKCIHEKEYQIVRSSDLCKEKTRLTTEFKNEFNKVKVSFRFCFIDQERVILIYTKYYRHLKLCRNTVNDS